MKIKGFVAACALVFAGSAMAGQCTTSMTNWGDMGPPAVVGFGHSFSSPGSFNDCYDFSLTSNALAFGGAVGIDPIFNSLDIDLTSVSLYSGLGVVGIDLTPGTFSFGPLGAGSYRLKVAGNVTHDFGITSGRVGYVGALFTVAAPVPEPEAYAMMLAGFLGVGIGVLRRKRA